ncbi:VOC family protein [Phenylobacterium sp.]|uniref:VOC family protein n=1 Tax=Phenylobacterium sp. TaxID=1871053 RepID=UPI003982D7E6
MLGYATLGANDLERSRAFYDAVLAPLGGKRTIHWERSQYYGSVVKGPMLGITAPFDGAPASPGNGAMLALQAPSRKAVDEAHAAALALGATCEGPPGLRTEAFYAAYFRDPDGNKLCAFRIG